MDKIMKKIIKLVNFRFPASEKMQMVRRAKLAKISAEEYCRQAVREKMQREGK